MAKRKRTGPNVLPRLRRSTASSSSLVLSRPRLHNEILPAPQPHQDRRLLRRLYKNLKLEITDRKEQFFNLDSDKFYHVLDVVERLHGEVSCPREQVIDVKVLLDMTSALLASLKDIKRGGGHGATEFVKASLKLFGGRRRQRLIPKLEESEETIFMNTDWEALGHVACHIFSEASSGINTMLCSLENPPKKKRRTSSPQRRQRNKLAQLPEVVRPRPQEETQLSCTKTDVRMVKMFKILRTLKSVSLEEVVLDRNCFSRTVENIFALSFLVKDGRAAMSIVNGRHLVGPKNFPSEQQLADGQAALTQFVFRFDFRDWQFMKQMVEPGRELMQM